jgi:hypothetical protein
MRKRNFIFWGIFFVAGFLVAVAFTHLNPFRKFDFQGRVEKVNTQVHKEENHAAEKQPHEGEKTEDAYGQG